jgi:hypothetical protein
LSASDVSAVPTTRKVNNKALSSNITLSAADVSAVPTTRTVNGKALSANITLSAADVGADASGAAATALTDAKSYTDNKVAGIVNSAPEALDTLNELAAALGDDANFATTVANQIGSKANSADLTTHVNNKSNPHGVTTAQIGALPLSGGTLTGPLMLKSGTHYGSTFPSGAQTGQIFFKKV